MTTPKITMSLNQIKAFNPCTSGWKTLLKALGKTEADDDPIPFEFIVESNGIQDAVWCFRVNWFEHKELYMDFVNECVKRAKQHVAFAAFASAYAYDAADSADSASAAAFADSAAAVSADSAADSAADSDAAAAFAAYDSAAAFASTFAAFTSAYAFERESQKQYLLNLLTQ